MTASVLASALAGAGLALLVETACARLTAGPAEDLVRWHPDLAVAVGGAGAVLLVALHAVTNRLALSLLLGTTAAVLLTFAHLSKLRLLGRPLMPWELVQLPQALALVPALMPGWKVLALAAGTVLLLILVGWLAARRAAWPLAAPVRGALLLGATLAGLWTQQLPAERVRAALASRSAEPRPWDLVATVQRTGLLPFLFWRAKEPTFQPPRGYAPADVQDAIARAEPLPPLGRPPQPPDVIVYMAEALWDPVVLDVAASEDPIPFVRSRLAQRPAGAVLSPVFGGGTSFAEFEILTGLPTESLPPDRQPLAADVMRRSPDSLAWRLKRAGYRTVGIHPFHAWYWNRRAAYPLLGFDEFQALDSFDDPPRFGPWPSDDAVVDRVQAELTRAGQPLFAFVVSMAGHGPYGYPVLPDNEIRFDRPYEWPDRHLLMNYFRALKHADQALERLTRFVEARERPTLLVAFGDHLPLLGEDFRIYRLTGWLKEGENPQHAARMHEVPAFAVANYPLPADQLRMPVFGLAPRVLQWAGFQVTGAMAAVEARRPARPRDAAVPDAAGDRAAQLLFHSLTAGAD